MNLRQAARGAACMNCGRQDETVVLAHYAGFRSYAYGKGRGVKCNDFFAAPQCAQCHAEGPFAEGYVMPGLESYPADIRALVKSEAQLHQIVMWHRERHERG